MFGRMKDPAEGTATVVGYAEQHEQKGSDVVLNAQVMVQAEGLVPTTVDARPRIPQSWMPVKLGTEWPVRVDRAKPERLEFLFDRVPGVAPAAAPAPATAPVVTRSVQTFSLPPQVQVIGGSLAPDQYKQAIDMAEQATGMDLDGDGKVAGGAAPAAGASPFAAFFQAAGAAGMAGMPAPVAPASDDPVSKLERLAKLLDDKAITREEFDAEKKKILGEAGAGGAGSGAQP
jgi:hypothetical protein